jgi:hypothetical protein
VKGPWYEMFAYWDAEKLGSSAVCVKCFEQNGLHW